MFTVKENAFIVKQCAEVKQRVLDISLLLFLSLPCYRDDRRKPEHITYFIHFFYEIMDLLVQYNMCTKTQAVTNNLNTRICTDFRIHRITNPYKPHVANPRPMPQLKEVTRYCSSIFK
jgi:hypothetical protein